LHQVVLPAISPSYVLHAVDCAFGCFLPTFAFAALVATCAITHDLAGAQVAAGSRKDVYGDLLPSCALMRLGTICLRHGGPVNAVVFSRDGTVLASASTDGLVCLWRIPDGHRLRAFSGHNGAVASVSLAPNGRLAASSGSDGSLRLWNLCTGQQAGQFARSETRRRCSGHLPQSAIGWTACCAAGSLAKGPLWRFPGPWRTSKALELAPAGQPPYHRVRPPCLASRRFGLCYQ
jgi:WD domain, G-beta repeat